MSETGMVLEIQRMSTEDGPGLRTSVFLKGCSLQCKWCHNPESISSKPDIQWRGHNCIGCRICMAGSAGRAFQFHDGKLIINRDMETDFATAVKDCPTGALEIIGQEWDAGSLVTEILKDKAYFTQTNSGTMGGVTISGGEPVLQSGFVVEIFQKLQAERIHVTLDTCGMYGKSKLESILPHVDLILFDIKEIDTRKHKEFTGSSNEAILENLKFINAYIRKNPQTRLWIRTPIIPHSTDTPENISGIAAFLRENDIHFDRWELCAFNNLCNDKYERLGMEWEYKNEGLLTDLFMDGLLARARADSSRPDRILWTGSVKKAFGDIFQEEKKNPIKAVNYCRITTVRT